MKGKATLTLSDARTGEVIRRMEEHNIVTDAISSIFNPTHYMIMNDFNYSRLFTGGLPLYEDLLAGVMLLGNTREENPADFMLDTSTVPVGHAGGEYAGANVMRGSLNLNETYPLENGYRFTWDFGTDKANGTIRCIGLTSKEFGNTGFNAVEDTDGAFAVNPQYIGSETTAPTGAFASGRGQYIGTFEPMIHLYAELNIDRSIVLRRYKAIDPSALAINTEVNMSEFWAELSETVIIPDFDVIYDMNFFLNTDDMTIYYFGGPNTQSDGKTMTVRYIGIDARTLTVTVNGAVTLQDYYYFDCCAVYNNHLYVLNVNGLQEYDMNGTLVKTHECKYAASSDMFMYNGCLMQKSGQKVYCYSWGDKTVVMNIKHNYLPLYSVDATPPYAAAAVRVSHAVTSGTSAEAKPVPYIISSYMATINNLSEPLEKTSQHTLKITYDITN